LKAAPTAVGSAERRARSGALLASGFHRIAFFFAVASVAVWTYFLYKWWGGEWWSLLLAIAAAVPVGLVFSILPSLLLRALEHLPLLNAVLLAWTFILGGIVLGVYGLIAFEGTTLAMVALAGAETVAGGVGRVMRT
jgi:hypothetical protein